MSPRFAKRLFFGGLMIGLLGLGVWFDVGRGRRGEPPVAAPLLVAAFTLPAVHELVGLLTKAGLPAARAPLIVASGVLLFGKACIEYCALEPQDAWFVVLLAGVLAAVAAWLVLDHDVQSGARRVAAAILVLVIVALQSTMFDVAYDWGTPLLFGLVLTSKAGDTGAYLTGKSLGRHKLLEHVSPKKTVEGAIGGFAASIVVGPWLLGRFGAGRWTTAELLLVAATVYLAGQIGGFVNSLCKRAAGVKDSGRMLPEFGGALDIVDSLFLAMPAGWALLAALEGEGQARGG
jgi:phosphatidate cytidylyltransferase